MGYGEEAMLLKLAGEAAAEHLLSIKRKGEEVLKQPGAVEGSLKDAMVQVGGLIYTRVSLPECTVSRCVLALRLSTVEAV